MLSESTRLGTPLVMAPEVLEGNKYDHSADVWSLGITAIELALGDPPHASHPPMKVVMLILGGEPPCLP